MSRLTTTHYLKTCHVLAEKWREHMDDFAFYSPQDQCYIHDYFRPSEDLTDDQRIAHRIAISKLHPSLPAKAGRALKQPEYQPIPLIYGRGKNGKQLHANDRPLRDPPAARRQEIRRSDPGPRRAPGQ